MFALEKRTEYLLMNKDQKVLYFSSETDEYKETMLEETSDPLSVLPIGFSDIYSFISQRQAPKHRKHIYDIMRKAGCDNLDGYLSITKALSLNDTFWVKQADSDLTWSDISLYRNDFDETIARLAFEGGNHFSTFSSPSPEYSTDGVYAKCWLRDHDSIYLLKSGSKQFEIEPYCEFYASQVAQHICNHSVKYTLDSYHDKLVSKCTLFTSEKEGFVSALKLLDLKKITQTSYLLDYFQKQGYEDDFRRMIVLDALIVNNDRHTGNYGFLVDNDTQKILKMAPVFDHNRSLAYAVKILDIASLKEYLKSEIPRIGMDFNEIAHSMLTSEIRSDLQNLRFFEFTRHDRFNLSEERIALLEEMLHNQIENIICNHKLYYYNHHVNLDAKIKNAKDVQINHFDNHKEKTIQQSLEPEI